MRELRELAAGFADTAPGADALGLAALLARTIGADLVAARVVHGVSERELQGAEEALRVEAAARLGDAGPSPRAAILVERNAAKALRDLAEHEQAIGLLALGATHRAGIGRVVPGGVADRLLAGSPCAIAIAPRGFAAEAAGERLRVIGVGFDGSPESHAALSLGASIAVAAGATVRVITVSPPAYGGVDWSEAAGEQSAPKPGDLQTRLLNAVADLPDAVRALPVHEHGSPAHWLIEHAEEGVDLLLMGSRGHGPVGAVLVGTTSNAVLAEATCPVLVVPRPALGSGTAT